MQHKHDRHPVEPERRILIVVPTYNEEGNIAPLTAALETALAATRYTYDLLFADDLSTDGTRKKIAAYQKKRLGVYLSSGRRAGLGKAYIRALTAGLRLGEYWAYVTLDADLSHDPNYIPQMLATLEDGADLVLGSRYVAGGGSGSDYSKFRRLLSEAANRLLGAATRVRDRTAGFRAIRGASLAALPLNRFAASGYFFAFEFIHACETEGLRITEVPIIFQARKHGKSKLRLRDIAEYLRYSYRLGSISGFKKIVDFGALYLLFLAVGITQLDPDFGWHLTTGNYVLSHWLPTHDIYSYTARSFAWIDHEWGNDVITVILYRLGGYPLTTAFFAALWSGAVYLAGSGRARLLTLLAAGFAVTTYTGTRPLAWTVFLFSLVLAILRSPSHRRRWALPLTFILWANLHAGFIAGLALIGYYLILERRRSTLLLLIACFTATLINAYGANIYTEITRTIGDPAIHKRIQEWLPFYINATSWTFISLWLAGLILHRPLLHHDHRPHWPRADHFKYWLGLSPLLMLATLSATRNLPLFVVSAVASTDHIVRQSAQLINRLDKRGRTIITTLTSCLGLFIALVVFAVYGPWFANREGGYPKTAVTYLKQHPCSGHLYNNFVFGGYLIWKLPGVPDYIDGRMPTWEPYMTNYVNISAQPANYAPAEFSRYNIKCALLEAASDKPLINYLSSRHWRTVVQADSARLMLAP